MQLATIYEVRFEYSIYLTAVVLFSPLIMHLVYKQQY